MSFADTEARLNAKVFGTFANAEATYTPGAGEPVVFAVVFDPAGGFIDELGTVSQAPTFTMQPSGYTDLEEGMALSIAGNGEAATAFGNYIVRSVVPVYEGGMQRVTLARAS